jgi:hypothetical protein
MICGVSERNSYLPVGASTRELQLCGIIVLKLVPGFFDYRTSNKDHSVAQRDLAWRGSKASTTLQATNNVPQ